MANRRPPHREGNLPRRPSRPGAPVRRGPGTASLSGTRREPRADQSAPDRLQKVLAHAGVGSRRACEEVILQGRVSVDGKVVRVLGTRVDPRRCRIAVDGQTIQSERMVYYAVNKPKGYVSTNNDPSGRPRVIDLLPEIPQRVYTVGRLDEMSTGLMLLTNDGELANRLSHPKFGVEKLYRAVVAGVPEGEVLEKITQGVWLAEGKVRARRVRIVGKKGEATVLELVLAEGKNREVRRMLAKFGHKVMSLTRVAVGPITTKGLAPGAFRPLSTYEIEQLQKVAAGIAVAPPRFSDRDRDRQTRRPAGRPGTTESRSPTGSTPRPRRTGTATTGGSPGGGVVRPQGPPPSQRPANGPNQGPRRPAGPRPQGQGQGPSRRPAPAPRPASPPPQAEPPRRRIIGLDPVVNPPRRPAPPKRKPPRAALGAKRHRPRKGDGE